MSRHLFLFCGSLMLLSSCTLGKIIAHFKPDTTDHEKVFACDTLPSATTAQVSLETMTLYDAPWAEAAQADALPPLDQWITAHDREEGETFTDLMQRTETTAFLVVRKDSLLYEQYANGGQRQQARIVFSVTKALVATLAAVAIEEGHLRLDQPVADFIPAFANDDRQGIRIEHLMNMTTGLRWNDFTNIWKLGNLYYTSDQAKYVTSRSKYRYEAGTHFAYQSLSTQILGLCLEKALEQPLADYFRVKLWEPLGMAYEGYMTLDSEKHRHARTFGGFALTARDMARFGQLMLHEGQWQGQQLVPEWFIQNLRTRDPNRWFGYRHSYWRSGYEEANWQQNQQHWAAGFLGQYIYIAPQEQMVVVRQGNAEDDNWVFWLGRLVALFDRGRNDLTDSALDHNAQFGGHYQSLDGRHYIKLDRQEPEGGPLYWTWRHNMPLCDGNHKLERLLQLDGISIGRKTRHKQTRLYYQLNAAGEVEGFYYHAFPAVETVYFQKVKGS